MDWTCSQNGSGKESKLEGSTRGRLRIRWMEDEDYRRKRLKDGDRRQLIGKNGCP